MDWCRRRLDGGGTKTEFLLTDLDGNEINRLILGATNPVDVGIDPYRMQIVI